MITKTITAEVYICEKCKKEYKNKIFCDRHESACDFKSSVAEIFVHDGVFTYPTIYSDAVQFYRMCMVGDIPADHHVWVYYNKQYTIGEDSDPISINNNYSEECDSYHTMNRLGKEEFFNYCDKLVSSRWDSSKKVSEHGNAIYVKDSSLKYHDIYVTYERGPKLKVDFKDPDAGYGDGKIPIIKNNRIKKIEIFDKESLEKEIVSTTHTLDTDMKDNLMYVKKEDKLYEFKKCHYSVKEEIAREFLNKTKMDLSNLKGYITLDGRRIAHNTDDWLNIETRNVEHFQGSRYGGNAYGMVPYKGKTLEEALLCRAFVKADERVKYSPKGRFQVGDLNVIMPDHHNHYYEGRLNFFEEETMNLIPHDKMLDILRQHNGVITVIYYE
jgi:hypothetical protein